MEISTPEVFVTEIGKLLKDSDNLKTIFAEGRKILEEFIQSREWFESLLGKLIADNAYAKSKWIDTDFNELKLYKDPAGMFSVRGFFWEPGVAYPIHDHGSWGIIGVKANKVLERKFVRLDDGSHSGYADIKESGRRALSPGETSFIMPLDKGIHQMSAEKDIAFSLHLYGRPARRGFINYFDENTKQVRRVYNGSLKARILAGKMLAANPDKVAEKILVESLELSKNEIIKSEFVKFI